MVIARREGLQRRGGWTAPSTAPTRRPTATDEEISARALDAICVDTFCIFCPVFNEVNTVPLFLERMLPVVAQLSIRCDVRLVFLNNASTDGTLEAILEARGRWPFIDVLSMSRNVGYQRSLDTGLRTVEADVYAFVDVDCEDPPEMLARMWQIRSEGYDVVYGERADRHEPRLLKSTRKLFYRLLRRVADDDIILDMAEFALFTREVRDAVIEENTSFPFIRASIARAGFSRIGLPYKRERRINGESHYSMFGMLVFGVGGILSASTLPLRLPIFILPFWLIGLTAVAVDYGYHSSPATLALGLLLGFGYLGLTAAFIALYVARSYKNGLLRPNAVLHRRHSTILPEPVTTDRPWSDASANAAERARRTDWRPKEGGSAGEFRAIVRRNEAAG